MFNDILIFIKLCEKIPKSANSVQNNNIYVIKSTYYYFFLMTNYKLFVFNYLLKLFVFNYLLNLYKLSQFIVTIKTIKMFEFYQIYIKIRYYAFFFI